MPHWTTKYIGLPYREFDCAQLVQLVLKKEFDFDFTLPQLIPKKIKERSQLIEKTAVEYPECSPFDGAIVLMDCRADLSHLGVYALIKGVPYVLHSMAAARQVVLHKEARLGQYNISVRRYHQWQKSPIHQTH